MFICLLYAYLWHAVYWGADTPDRGAQRRSWVTQKRVPSVHCAALVERPTWIVVPCKSVICGLWHIAAVVAWVGVVRVLSWWWLKIKFLVCGGGVEDCCFLTG